MICWGQPQVFSNKKLENSGKFRLNHNLDTLPMIDRDLTNWHLYSSHNSNFYRAPGAYTMFGRDCWWGKCTFCSWTQIFPHFRTRSAENLLDEMGVLVNKYKVKEIMDKQKGAKILVGDFNLLPETESIKVFETNMRNLIKEFNIGITRSNLSPFYGKSDFQKFADYTFVTKDIDVKSFEVPQVEISDHLPMILKFS